MLESKAGADAVGCTNPKYRVEFRLYVVIPSTEFEFSSKGEFLMVYLQRNDVV